MIRGNYLRRETEFSPCDPDIQVNASNPRKSSSCMKFEHITHSRSSLVFL